MMKHVTPDRVVSPPGFWQRIREHRRAFQNLALVVAGVVIALAALSIFNAVNPQPRITQRDIEKIVAQAMASATPSPSVASQVYAMIAPSLVQISTRFANGKGGTDRGQGTGIVLDEKGTILTSLHVVKGATDILVTFADGSESRAVLAASDAAQDTAVLRTMQPPAELIPATLGSSASLQVGDQVVAVGHPFGLTNSVTAGVVSGLGRTYKPKDGEMMRGLIQFDAAVNPGNSGGPLLNRDGEVVGIVTGLVNPTSQEVFVGIGFAVPIDTAGSVGGPPPF